jgi:hypothetical protein
MDSRDVFVSVGSTATPSQEAFVRAIEDRLRAEGLVPHTVGRNSFSADAPLKAVARLLDSCAGAVVIAFERTYFQQGTEKRGGPNESPLQDVKLATPWNQIEAAMAYARGLPLMVIVESGLKSEGLLENGYDWYVQWVPVDASTLQSAEFNGVLASWKTKLVRPGRAPSRLPTSPTEMTVSDLVGGLKPAQLWGLLGALASALAGAFLLGSRLGGP